MRVLSYNIHKGIGGHDRRYQIDRVVRVIEHEDPDLICLQEVTRGVRRSRFDDQPAIFSERLRAEARMFQLNVRLKTGGYGNLLLSRWPLRDKHQLSLRQGSKKPRGAQLAVVDTPEGPLHLVNWHLGLAESERRWQVDRLLGHPRFRESAHLPTLIVGDFNDWRDTLARACLSRHGFSQVTAPRSRFRSFPAFLAMSSLDKAFSRGPISIRHARIVRTAQARCASDHLPLVADFHLDRNETESSFRA